MALAAHHLIRCPALATVAPALRTERLPRLCSIRGASDKSQDSGEGGNRRRIWRRRRLTKNDDKLRYKMDRIPFLEEQNRFDFVNEVAAEATSYIEANRDEYGSKKAILHVLSNRMNEAGFERSEAYMEEDPFRPGPSYLKELDT
ncbi:hypothetical protein MUK42_27164 [Musa troglodytarum]|uniref:Protein PLASTID TRANSCRIPTIONALLY ACTIVE 7 n=1 Tax=Musa troglodytarum TaxID=320322 RepID=A0A9E7JLD1_9LILI|nr:hypothetical protein MUK42_27164 [Musa troglodytarum]